MSPGIDRWLRGLAPIVPDDVRRDWLREWRAEFEFRASRAARLGNALGWRGAWYAAGALPHAVWLRWDRWRVDMLWQDIKHAWRALAKRPGFTAVTLGTLAFGIGSTATIFGAVYAVLLRPLPFPEPDRLVQVMETSTRNPGGMAVSPPNFVDWRRDSSSFTGMAAISSSSYALSGDGRTAEQVSGAQVTGDFFGVLATRAARGRTIEAADAVVGGPDVVVLSHGLWARRFGSDPNVVGSRITIDGTSREVVGVMPPGFAYPLQSDVWMPLPFTENDLTTQRGAHYLDVIARLGPGASLDSARAEITRIGDRLAVEYERWNAHESATVAPLRDVVVGGDARRSLVVLLGAVGLVLLIVCVNVASLVLVRSMGRGRELAVRMAVGAGRASLVRGLLVESLMLGVAGGVAGVLLAWWATAAISSANAAVGIPLLDQTRLDGAVVAFALGVTLVATVLFGTLPAWQATRGIEVSSSMREEGGSTTADPRRQWWRASLIVAETTLAVVLLVGAGLLARSFIRLMQVELGFETARLQTFSVTLPDGTYKQPPQRAAFIETLLHRVKARPDVEAAAAIFGLPLTDFGYSISVSALDGVKLDNDEQMRRSVQVRVVSPGYFAAMGIAVRRGRDFTSGDHQGLGPVAVLSESAAERLFPGADPLGHHVELGTRLGQGGASVGGDIVGVVADVHDRGPALPGRPTLYAVHAQFPVSFVTVVAKTRGAPSDIVEPLRAAMADLDPDVPMFRVRTMQQIAASSVAQPRVYLMLIALFAGSAMILAALGLYGVLAYAVGQRTREIGIRRALGAGHGEVVHLVTRQAIALTSTGIGAGLAAAFATSRVLRAQLFEVTPTDLATYAAVAAGVALVGLAAAVIPARRAARIDPMQALRHD